MATERPDLHALREQAQELHRGLQAALEAAGDTDLDFERLEAAAYLAEKIYRSLRLIGIRRWRESVKEEGHAES